MIQLLFASTNKGKLVEVREIAREFGITIVSPSEICGGKDVPEVEESAATYKGNAQLKGEAFMKWSGLPSLSDDTGLEVEALGGRPGVFSARYAGPRADPKKNIEKLLEVLKKEQNRKARFYSYLYLSDPHKPSRSAEGVLSGSIAKTPEGGGGFGYDSVFLVEGHNKTLASLKESGVKVETHRIKALRALFAKLK